jgi:putative ABC transport system substrate-binding protein
MFRIVDAAAVGAVILFAVSIPGAHGAVAEGTRIAVAVSSNAPAFDEAVASFRTALGEDGSLVFLVQLDKREPPKSLIGGARARVAVAFGSRAAEALALSDPDVPLVVTMVLTTDAAGTVKPQQLVSTVSLSVNPASILTKLKIAFPDRKRLAVLLSPNTSPLRSELVALALRLGYVLEVVECSGPRDVLGAFAALRGRVDFVWCLPDSDLFPSAAIPPILLASIKNQLPVIGFSEGLVRAGAAVGFYPDYADIGVQTADMVKRYLAKQSVSRLESPHKIRMAVNDRVLHILGIERPKLTSEAIVIR